MVQWLPCGQGDWLFLGIIIYAMLTGTLPFYKSEVYRLKNKISNAEVKYLKQVSCEAALIVSRVSVINIKTEALKVP